MNSTERHRQRGRGKGQRQRPIKAVGEWHINEHITHYLQPEKICKIVGVVAEAAVGSLESRRGESSRVEFGVGVEVAVGAANH